MTVVSPLKHKKLEQGEGEFKTENFLIESLQKAARARKIYEGRQEKGPGEVKKRHRYEICVHECFHGFARVVYDRVLAYAMLETSELCYSGKACLVAGRTADSLWETVEKRVCLR